jgi:hypothetical protein
MAQFFRLALVMTLTIGLGLRASAAGFAQSDTKAATVAGRWTMSVDAGPHGTMTMGLVLEQKGKRVTGTFSSPHGDVGVEGEFTDGTLTLTTTATDGHEAMHVTFNARLQETGTLSGYLSSEMGDMKWTADRMKEKS